MSRKNKINVKGTEITVLKEDIGDFFSITDMLKAKDGDFFVSDWLRNRNTVEFLGIWESVSNPNFNYGEFATIRSQAGLNNYKTSVKEWVEKTNALFGITAKQWRDTNPDKEGNMRDYATIEQLVVLSNLESINAVLIHQGLPQADRLKQLNQIAIQQMKSMVNNVNIKKLK